MQPPLLLVNGILADPSSPPRLLTDHALLIEHGRIARIAPRSSFAATGGDTMDVGGKTHSPRVHQCTHASLQHLSPAA